MRSKHQHHTPPFLCPSLIAVLTIFLSLAIISAVVEDGVRVSESNRKKYDDQNVAHQ
jgi:hypothetical protein